MVTKTKSAAKKTAKPKRATKPMPRFDPAPEWLKESFANAISYFPEAEPRKMFGYPSAFINGQMFTSVFASRVMLRLSETNRAKFAKLPGGKGFEMTPGRAMKEYVDVPEAMLKKPADFRKWLKKSIDYTRTLPPKKAKSKV